MLGREDTDSGWHEQIYPKLEEDQLYLSMKIRVYP
jgi:hypothetical protein